MPFMVIYRTSDGASCHEQSDAIDEAALFVERLRNQDGIEEIRIYRMDEISFAFRPYYKVELGMPERVAATSPPPEVIGLAPTFPVAEPPSEPPVDVLATPEAELPVDAPAPVSAGADDAESAANGRRGLFGR
jgi:hypothetical protein